MIIIPISYVNATSFLPGHRICSDNRQCHHASVLVLFDMRSLLSPSQVHGAKASIPGS